MLSYADENDIKYKPNDSKNWELCHGDNKDCILNCDCNKCEYRIKQKPTYRPFKDSEECWNEMLKHQPFGWIRNKNNKTYTDIKLVGGYPDCGIDGRDYPKMFNDFTFADGTPLGIKED